VLSASKEIIVVPIRMLLIKAPPIPPAKDTIQSFSQPCLRKRKKSVDLPLTLQSIKMAQPKEYHQVTLLQRSY